MSSYKVISCNISYMFHTCVSFEDFESEVCETGFEVDFKKNRSWKLKLRSTGETEIETEIEVKNWNRNRDRSWLKTEIEIEIEIEGENWNRSGNRSQLKTEIEIEIEVKVCDETDCHLVVVTGKQCKTFLLLLHSLFSNAKNRVNSSTKKKSFLAIQLLLLLSAFRPCWFWDATTKFYNRINQTRNIWSETKSFRNFKNCCFSRLRQIDILWVTNIGQGKRKCFQRIPYSIIPSNICNCYYIFVCYEIDHLLKKKCDFQSTMFFHHMMLSINKSKLDWELLFLWNVHPWSVESIPRVNVHWT